MSSKLRSAVQVRHAGRLAGLFQGRKVAGQGEKKGVRLALQEVDAEEASAGQAQASTAPRVHGGASASARAGAEGVKLSPKYEGKPLFAAEPANRSDIPLHEVEKNRPRPVLVHADPPEDPMIAFVRQGKELLKGIEDGGDLSLISRTGVDGVWCLQLENLAEGNAVTGEMMMKLEEAMRMVNRAIKTDHELLALIIRGSGLNFSFGTAQSVHQELYEHDEGLVLSRYMQTILMELQCLPIITIAAVEGVCAGSAAEIALACDFRICAKDAMLQFSDVAQGLVPGWGGLGRLQEIATPRAALLLAASGKPITPEEGLGLGIVDAVCNAGDTYNEAIHFVESNLHDHSGLGGTHGELTWRRHGIRRMKENVVAAGLFPKPESQLAIEARNFQATWVADAKMMVERRAHVSGLRRASLKTALEDWSTITDPFAMSLPLDEDVGYGLAPTKASTMIGQASNSVERAFTALFSRKANQAIAGSPQSESFVKHKYLEEKTS
ncbi:putative enoyl-CoA hydratase [Diplonema papillatum]|nr:putative enoyl-CoA hydratase [Diplonema papillatum]KAJ9456816.1 putative enoyl-CoA hydratase [Diplonema papillatum]KAJ9456817.1 putative enoyl-CoA hydratase [Diplonema papillatum]